MHTNRKVFHQSKEKCYPSRSKVLSTMQENISIQTYCFLSKFCRLRDLTARCSAASFYALNNSSHFLHLALSLPRPSCSAFERKTKDHYFPFFYEIFAYIVKKFPVLGCIKKEKKKRKARAPLTSTVHENEAIWIDLPSVEIAALPSFII